MTTTDLRRECHCGKRGIGPHWFSQLEGCPSEPVESPAVMHPEHEESAPERLLSTAAPVFTDEATATCHRAAEVVRTHHLVQPSPFGPALDELFTCAAEVFESGPGLPINISSLRGRVLALAQAVTGVHDLRGVQRAGAGPEQAVAAPERQTCGDETTCWGKPLVCIGDAGHFPATPHRNGNGTSWGPVTFVGPDGA